MRALCEWIHPSSKIGSLWTMSSISSGAASSHQALCGASPPSASPNNPRYGGARLIMYSGFPGLPNLIKQFLGISALAMIELWIKNLFLS